MTFILETGQYFGTSQNGIEDKKNETEVVHKECMTKIIDCMPPQCKMSVNVPPSFAPAQCSVGYIDMLKNTMIVYYYHGIKQN